MTIIIDGKKVSEEILERLRQDIVDLKTKYNKAPGLAVILVGEDQASMAYVGSKKRACARLGIKSFEYKLPDTTKEEELVALIEKLNKNSEVNGILLQLPLPKGLNEQKLLELIEPKKDVDGFHPINVGKLLLGLETFIPCTPAGVIELLKAYQLKTYGTRVVIVGRSNIVGKPLAALLMQKGEFANATVTVCHSKTKNIKEICGQADILIAAIGHPQFITADFIKVKAIVIDVGINRVEDSTVPKGYKLVGDVDFENVKDKTSFITPVPGGVGLMTIACLMKSTVNAFVKGMV